MRRDDELVPDKDEVFDKGLPSFDQRYVRGCDTVSVPCDKLESESVMADPSATGLDFEEEILTPPGTTTRRPIKCRPTMVGSSEGSPASAKKSSSSEPGVKCIKSSRVPCGFSKPGVTTARPEGDDC